jgi:two-component system sensor histidine kinase CpxA
MTWLRSFYARTFAWFLVSVLITAAGVILVSTLRQPDFGAAASPFRLLAETQLEAARAAYEQGGADGLRAHLDAFHKQWNVQAALLDASGRDLLTGEDNSELFTQSRRRPPPVRFLPLYPRSRPVIFARSRDQKFAFSLKFPEFERPWIYPHEIWLIVSAALLCFIFARSVTAPIRKLQAVVNEFGHGNWNARAALRRSDELGQLGDAFNNMAWRISHLLASQRRLLLDISHEIRTPLTRLGLAVELARSGGDREAALARIQREADRLNELVGGLLQVTRAESEAAAATRERVDLSALLARVAGDCALEAQARGGEIQYDTPPPIHLTADPELLRRAFENVTRNAIRYSTRVVLHLESRNGEVIVRIRDFGPGVPEKELSNLFEAFYRVREEQQPADGFGLGLAIAQRAVELHGGTISARNARPGLEIEVRLPVQGAMAMSA